MGGRAARRARRRTNWRHRRCRGGKRGGQSSRPSSRSRSRLRVRPVLKRSRTVISWDVRAWSVWRVSSVRGLGALNDEFFVREEQLSESAPRFTGLELGEESSRRCTPCCRGWPSTRSARSPSRCPATPTPSAARWRRPLKSRADGARRVPSTGHARAGFRSGHDIVARARRRLRAGTRRGQAGSIHGRAAVGRPLATRGARHVRYAASRPARLVAMVYLRRTNNSQLVLLHPRRAAARGSATRMREIHTVGDPFIGPGRERTGASPDVGAQS